MTTDLSAEIAALLATALPDGASAAEREDFARGLAVLAGLLRELAAGEAGRDD